MCVVSLLLVGLHSAQPPLFVRCELCRPETLSFVVYYSSNLILSSTLQEGRIAIASPHRYGMVVARIECGRLWRDILSVSSSCIFELWCGQKKCRGPPGGACMLYFSSYIIAAFIFFLDLPAIVRTMNESRYWPPPILSALLHGRTVDGDWMIYIRSFSLQEAPSSPLFFLHQVIASPWWERRTTNNSGYYQLKVEAIHRPISEILSSSTHRNHLRVKALVPLQVCCSIIPRLNILWHDLSVYLLQSSHFFLL